MATAAPTASAPRLVGILNVTPDSFSDGGCYTDPQAAIDHALALRGAGADVIELGPASSRPDAAEVSAAEEQRRLTPVLVGLHGRGVALGVDSYWPATQRFALAAGALWLNDIQGFADPNVYEDLARSAARLVVMHSIAGGGTATRDAVDPQRLPERIEAFFERRVAALLAGGVRSEQLILDPGMGFFLGRHSTASLHVLRWLPALRKRFDLPVLISVSRKSFLAAGTDRPPAERGAATLAAELFAADQGADYLRTHDVRAIADALRVHRALRMPPA